MSTTIQHRRVNIVTLQPGENGEVDCYDKPFDNYNQALWAAKAAAEFSSEGE